MQDDFDQFPLWKRLLLRYLRWGSNNPMWLGAIAVGTPIMIFQIIAYDNGYSGWLDMVWSWFSAD